MAAAIASLLLAGGCGSPSEPAGPSLSIVPSPPAAGQMVTVQGTNLPDFSTATATFAQGTSNSNGFSSSARTRCSSCACHPA
jgi:hypothetical protein